MGTDPISASAQVRWCLVHLGGCVLRANNSKPSSAKQGGRSAHEIGVNHVVLNLHIADAFLPF